MLLHPWYDVFLSWTCFRTSLLGQAGRTYGSPYCNGTPDDVNNLNLPDRSTVQDTYEQAIDDLKVAARLMENGETKREGPAYASKEAAWAMLSRIYLL